MPFAGQDLTDADAYGLLTDWMDDSVKRVLGADESLGTDASGMGITISQGAGWPQFEARKPFLADADVVSADDETRFVNYALAWCRLFLRVFADRGVATPPGFDIADVAVDDANGWDGSPAGTAINVLAELTELSDAYNANLATINPSGLALRTAPVLV